MYTPWKEHYRATICGQVKAHVQLYDFNQFNMNAKDHYIWYSEMSLVRMFTTFLIWFDLRAIYPSGDGKGIKLEYRNRRRLEDAPPCTRRHPVTRTSWTLRTPEREVMGRIREARWWNWVAMGNKYAKCYVMIFSLFPRINILVARSGWENCRRRTALGWITIWFDSNSPRYSRTSLKKVASIVSTQSSGKCVGNAGAWEKSRNQKLVECGSSGTSPPAWD